MQSNSEDHRIRHQDATYANILELPELLTPAFVYDEAELARSLRVVQDCTDQVACGVLYALKAGSFHGMLELIAENVQGFACSSLFEAQLARDLLADRGTVHLTTPGLRPDEISGVKQLCDYVTFNSLSQWERFQNEFEKGTHCGLRVDPKLSFVRDERYDPCRKYSKLGVPIRHMIEIQDNVPARLDGITGLHFHTNCDSTNFIELFDTVRHVEARLGPLLEKVKWINLGGGYLFDDADNIDALHDTIDLLHTKYRLEVFIEPGSAIARSAGYLVSTVLDIFSSDGKTIVVLDTAVNHMPEVFEYQFEPDVRGHVDEGQHAYVLVGRTCLAGDVFGEYTFDEPLQIGSRVIFTNAGSYTLAKANTFNGINLPTIYAHNATGEIELKKRFTYEDFSSKCGVHTHACI